MQWQVGIMHKRPGMFFDMQNFGESDRFADQIIIRSVNEMRILSNISLRILQTFCFMFTLLQHISHTEQCVILHF